MADDLVLMDKGCILQTGTRLLGEVELPPASRASSPETPGRIERTTPTLA